MEGYVLADNGRLTEKEARLNMEQCADFLARMIQKYGPEITRMLQDIAGSGEDMSDRLDNRYDRISEFDEKIASVDARIQAAYEKQITGKNVYQFLLDFDTLYEKMTDLEKKQ